MSPHFPGRFNELIYGCEWYKLYDACERIASLINEENQQSLRQFKDALNQVLLEEGIGYEMKAGLLERVGGEHFDAAVSGATHTLAPSAYEVPHVQFRKALGFRNGHPPDYPNAVKEAVNAVEEVWQVVSGKPGIALPTLLSEAAPPLPSGLRKLYDGLYGYGSGSQGARHACVGGHPAGGDEAEFVIHTTAAAITCAIEHYG